MIYPTGYDALTDDGFPMIIDDPSRIFPYEKNYEQWLLDREHWFWRWFGVHKPIKNVGATPTPDLLTTCLGNSRHPIRFGIEVEHKASNFIAHKHQSFNIHLIMALYAGAGHYFIKGVPVICLYRKCSDRMYHYSLSHDIDVVYHDEKPTLF